MLSFGSVTLKVKDSFKCLIRQVVLHHLHTLLVVPSSVSVRIFATVEIRSDVFWYLFKGHVHVLLIVDQVLVQVINFKVDSLDGVFKVSRFLRLFSLSVDLLGGARYSYGVFIGLVYFKLIYVLDLDVRAVGLSNQSLGCLDLRWQHSLLPHGQLSLVLWGYLEPIRL